MGFDKPDLGFVVHLGAPPSPIAYYQQVGRAGRAVEHADVLLLPGREDQAIWQYFASLAFPPAAQVAAVLDVLADADRPLSTPALEARVELRRSRLELMLKVLDVDGAVRRVRGGWMSTGQPWEYDESAARPGRGGAPRGGAVDARLRGDDRLPDGVPAPRARRSGRRHLRSMRQLHWTGARGGDLGRSARCGPGHLGRPGLEIAPRRQWPTALTIVSGKIPGTEVAETGRALGRFSDLGWGDRLRRLLAPDAPDAPVPAEIVTAMVEVLADWATGGDRWSARPIGVVSVGSSRHPILIRSLATRIGEIGRLPHIGEVEAGGTDEGRANSAHRVKALFDRVTVGDSVAAKLGDGPILLVDDYVDSGWTMALAARALRQAGAPAVLPLALAQAT